MGQNTAPERPPLMIGATEVGSCSFAGNLKSGELLTGTPLVVEQTTSELTITSKVINTAAVVINNKTVAVGQAVTFLVTGQVLATSKYTLLVTATTDSTPARVLPKKVIFLVVDE